MVVEVKDVQGKSMKVSMVLRSSRIQIIFDQFSAPNTPFKDRPAAQAAIRTQ